ncbi:MAG: isoaspartyl peptidase/L-asparaginase [Nitrospirae bacterium]|nr:isoaspartyl peptidase/L-asparaginase [Nitrospirota bacterium]
MRLRRRLAIIVHGGAGRIEQTDVAVRRTALHQAAQAGARILKKGGAALEAVIRAVRVLEDHPLFNAGRGSVLTSEGTVECDASLMSSDGRCGAVGAVRNIRHPILLAERVMKRTRHVLIVGRLPQALTRGLTAPATHLITADRRQHYELLQKRRAGGHTASGRLSPHSSRLPLLLPRLTTHDSRLTSKGTVGAVALDRHGSLAAATSTGGTWLKLPGRVGDSAIIGAGTYASPLAAFSATGWGEGILRLMLTYRAAEMTPRFGVVRAVRQAIRLARREGVECGLIGVDARGRLAYHYNTKAMDVACATAGSGAAW